MDEHSSLDLDKGEPSESFRRAEAEPSNKEHADSLLKTMGPDLLAVYVHRLRQKVPHALTTDDVPAISALLHETTQLGAMATRSAGTSAWESTKRLRALLDLMLANVVNEGDETALLTAAAQCASVMTSADSVRIFVMDQGAIWFSTPEAGRQHHPLEEAGLAGYVAEVKQNIALDQNAVLHPHFNREVDWGLAEDPAAMLCGPVRDVDGSVTGVVVAGKAAAGPFSIEDRVVLEAVGKMAITTLRQAQKIARDRLDCRAANELLSTLSTLDKDTPAETVLRVLGQHARALLNCARCRVFLCNPKQKVLVYLDAKHRSEPLPRRSLLADLAFSTGNESMLHRVDCEWGKGIVGHVAMHGQPMCANCVRKDSHFDAAIDSGTAEDGAFLECVSVLAMPVRSHDGSTGAVIELLDKHEGWFDPTDHNILRRVAELCAKEIAANVELAHVRRVKAQSDVLIHTCETLNVPIHNILSGESGLDQLQRELTWRCMMLVNAEHCALYMVRTAGSIELELVAHTHRTPLQTAEGTPQGAPQGELTPEGNGAAPDIRFARGRGLVGSVAEASSVKLIEEPAAEPQFDPTTDDPLNILGEGDGIHSMGIVAVPDPSAKDECIAVLQVFNKQTKGAFEAKKFDDGDARVLVVYGRLVGWVMSHVSSIAKMTESVSSTSKMLDFAVAVIANLQPQSLYHNITTLAGQLVPCDWATLYLADDSNSKVLYQLLEGRPSGPVVKAGEGAPGLVAQTLESVVLRSAQTHPRFTPDLYGDYAGQVREVLAMPLCDMNAELKGVLELVNRSSGSFSKTDEEQLQLYCKICGISMLSARTLENAQRAAAADKTSASGCRSSSVEEPSVPVAEKGAVQPRLLSDQRLSTRSALDARSYRAADDLSKP